VDVVRTFTPALRELSVSAVLIRFYERIPAATGLTRGKDGA
jgi:hypothetical protein